MSTFYNSNRNCVGNLDRPLVFLLLKTPFLVLLLGTFMETLDIRVITLAEYLPTIIYRTNCTVSMYIYIHIHSLTIK